MKRTTAIILLALIGGGLLFVDHAVIATHCDFIETRTTMIAGKFEGDVDVYDCGSFGEYEVVR